MEHFNCINFDKHSSSMAKRCPVLYSLPQLASTCEFTDPDGEVRFQVNQRCISTKLRETPPRDGSITLAKLLEHARAFANSAKKPYKWKKLLPQQNKT